MLAMKDQSDAAKSVYGGVDSAGIKQAWGRGVKGA